MSKYINRMDPELEEAIQEDIRAREDANLSPYASKNDEGHRRKPNSKDDVRTRYARDADRIIHTHAFTRYIDKTQVFFSVDNDHITHRVLHVQMVSKIGRTIGRTLRLNEDLIEAIALGHDIGHVAYGHIGEGSLSRLCEMHGIGQFHHNIESVHMLQGIEDCNLTLQVVDGIFTHNGEVHVQRLAPERDRSWGSLDRDIHRVVGGETDGPPSPMTLEGCVVRFSDVIAYLGRDIEDALELGLIEGVDEIPNECKERIGTTNPDIINSLIIDLIQNSYEQDQISFSMRSPTSFKSTNSSTTTISTSPWPSRPVRGELGGCSRSNSRPSSGTLRRTIGIRTSSRTSLIAPGSTRITSRLRAIPKRSGIT